MSTASDPVKIVYGGREANPWDVSLIGRFLPTVAGDSHLHPGSEDLDIYLYPGSPDLAGYVSFSTPTGLSSYKRREGKGRRGGGRVRHRSSEKSDLSPGETRQDTEKKKKMRRVYGYSITSHPYHPHKTLRAVPFYIPISVTHK